MKSVLIILVGLFLASPSDAVELEGPLTQGGMVTGVAEPGTKLTLDGVAVPVAENGRFIFGFGRDAASRAMLEITYPDGRAETLTLDIATREYDIRRIDGLPQRTGTVPPEEQTRRRQERAMVGEARAVFSEQFHWTEDFILPAEGRISGVYGSQSILNGEPRSPHYGLDIAAPTGTPVVAPASGTIVLAETGFLFEGGLIIIDHGFGVFSALLHLNTVDVKTGDEVKRGEVIATLGATGRATGPHVDWRMNWRNVRIDPGLLVDLETE